MITLKPFLNHYPNSKQLLKGAKLDSFEGIPTIRTILSSDGKYQQFNSLKTGKLVGLKEGNYQLSEKNGELVEKIVEDIPKFSIYING